MSCNNCNDYNSSGCGCTSHTHIENNCGCPEPAECSCKVYLSSDCINDVKSEFPCLGIESGLPLTQTLEAIDEAICDKLDTIQSNFQLVNVGAGNKVYKGVNLLGQKEIKTLTSIDNSVVITSPLNSDTINFSVTPLVPDVYTIANEGTGAKILDETSSTSKNFKLKTLKSANSSVTVSENSQDINLSVPTYTVENQGAGVKILNEVDSTPTAFKLKSLKSANSSVLITEDSNSINLNVVAVEVDVNITAGANVVVTEPTLNNFVISSTNTIVTLTNGVNTKVNGDGVVTPYSVEVNNLQKTVSSFPYTLTSADDKYTIFVENGAVALSTINVPNTLVNNFSCVFIQKGTGDVEMAATGTSNLLYPSTLINRIKGQNYWVMVEKELATVNYFLMGNLKTV